MLKQTLFTLALVSCFVTGCDSDTDSEQNFRSGTVTDVFVTATGVVDASGTPVTEVTVPVAVHTDGKTVGILDGEGLAPNEDDVILIEECGETATELDLNYSFGPWEAGSTNMCCVTMCFDWVGCTTVCGPCKGHVGKVLWVKPHGPWAP